MRKLSKILVLVLVLMTLLTAVSSFTASAANTAGTTLYLKPNSNWIQANARFAAYFMDANKATTKWVSMADADADGYYEVTIPSGSWKYVIFVRMDPANSTNDWSNKWNQTADLTIPTDSKNCFTLASGNWDGASTTWSTYVPTCTSHNYNEYGKCTNSGCTAGHTYTVAGTGAHLGTEWDTANANNHMLYNATSKTYTKVYENVAAGSYMLKCAQDDTWDVAYPANDYAYTVEKSGSTVTVTLKDTTVTITVEAPHTCEFVAGEVVAPTFDSEGYTVYTCTCGKTENRDVVPALVAVAQIGDVKYETLAEALEAAKAMTGDVVVEILDKVTLNSSLSGSYDSITFVGMDTDAEIYLDVQGYITATGKTVNFKDLTLSKSAGGFITNAGFMNVAFGVYSVNEVNYTNCVFSNGAYASSGDVTFTGCTFYRSHDKYGLWAYGDVNAVVQDSVFADYRGIKMYAEDKAKTTELTVKNTDFSAVNNKPAIVLTYGQSVTLSENTYSDTGVFELDLDGAPNGVTVTSDVAPTCKNDNGACGVLVDGKIYTTVAQAAEVATSGSTVTLLHDSTETVEFAEGVNLDKNGHTADSVTIKTPAVYVAQVGDVKYTSVIEALLAAAENGASEVKILQSVREAMPTDIEFIVNADLLITADSAVELKFYNDGTSYDFIFNSNNNNTVTIGENVTFELEDRVIWLGYYGNNVDLVVNGTFAGYQIWHGADTTVNATGTIKTTGEAFVMRRGATLTVNGGKVEANYFNILSGNIFAENAEITCGAFWIANTGSYTNEGNVSISIWESTLTSSGNFKSSTSHSAGVSIDVYDSVVKFEDFDGYGASQLDASTTLWVNGENAELTFKSLTNNGTIDVYDNGTLIVTNTLTNNNYIEATDATLKFAKLDNDNLMFLNGQMTIKVEDATGSSYAIRVNDGVVFNNSYVKGTANETIRLLGSVTFNGGFECAYLQGSSQGIGGTVTIEDGTTVHATYGVEFSKDYVLNGGTIELSGGNANGGIWGMVFQSGTYEINTDLVVIGNDGAYAPIHFTDVNAVVNSSITQKNSGGEPLYIGNISEVTLGAEAVVDALSVHGAGKLNLEVTENGGFAEIKCGASGFTGTLSTVANDKYIAKIVDGKIVVEIKPPVVEVNGVGYLTLEEAAAAAKSGDTITLLEDVILSETLTLPAGITLNGNGKQINGSIVAGGDLTFEGYTKVTSFNAGYTMPTITIGVGATLEMLSGRIVIGHGATFNITGSIVDAKNTDISTVTPSLIAPGASFTGAGLNFNLTNAYVKFTAYCSSKNSNANGTYNINVTNSVWEQTGSLVFSEPTNGMDPTFNFNVKDSVLNSTSHLVFAVSKGEIVFDNSNVNIDAYRQVEIRSTMILKNGSVIYASDATSSNAKKPGTLIVDNATYLGKGEYSGSDVGIGTLILRNNANVTLGTISKTNVTIDVTSILTATKVSDLTTTTITVDTANVGEETKIIDLSGNESIESIVTVNGSGLAIFGDDGDVSVVKVVAKIGDVYYTSLAEAFAAANTGDTIVLQADVSLSETITVPAGMGIVLDLNGKTINADLAEGSTTNHIYVFTNNGTLLLKGNGVINTRGIYNYGNLTLENGTINAIDANGGYGVINYTGSMFVMNGGKIATTLEDGDLPGAGYDATTVAVKAGATFIMNGGEIENISNFTFAIDNSGTTTINNGKIYSVHTTIGNSGHLTVNGGEFTCDGLEGITAHVVWAAEGTTTINGGTFNGKDNYNGFNVDASEGAVVNITGGNFLNVHSGSLYGEGTIAVSGGKFFDDVSDRLAVGYTIISGTDENGNTVYGVMEEAKVPYIKDGYWWIDGINTGIKAEGTDGEDGKDGVTPTLKIENGHVWVSYDEGATWEDLGNIMGSDGNDGQPGQDGSDGATPKLKIENGILYVSYNNGETWEELGNIKGEDGQPGQDGSDGEDGEDGITPIFKIEDGHLWVSYDNEATWKDLGNIKGDNGSDGSDGSDGEDGVTPTLKLEGGNLWVSYDNGATWEDLGSIKGEQGEPGKDGITPTLKLEGGHLWVSYDNGETWTDLGNVTGSDGNDGNDGNDGQPGQDGNPGIDGITPMLKVEDGHLKVSYDKGATWEDLGNIKGDAGNDGSAGADGKPGQDGTDGITPIFKIENGHLWVSYDNEANWKDLGNIQGANGENGSNGSAGENGQPGQDGEDGKDGITPQLRINPETNEWEVSYDNGETWTSLGVKATGDKGEQGEKGEDGEDMTVKPFIDKVVELLVKFARIIIDFIKKYVFLIK